MGHIHRRGLHEDTRRVLVTALSAAFMGFVVVSWASPTWAAETLQLEKWLARSGTQLLAVDARKMAENAKKKLKNASEWPLSAPPSKPKKGKKMLPGKRGFGTF